MEYLFVNMPSGCHSDYMYLVFAMSTGCHGDYLVFARFFCQFGECCLYQFRFVCSVYHLDDYRGPSAIPRPAPPVQPPLRPSHFRRGTGGEGGSGGEGDWEASSWDGDQTGRSRRLRWQERSSCARGGKRFTDWLNDWLVDWWIGWWIDWLVEWLA